MQHDRALTPANQYDETLAQVGAIADTYARQDVFEDYQERKPENTRRRQLADLRLFARYLAEAGVQRDAEMLYSDPEAWRGITSGLIEGFVKWQISKGYAIGSINVRLSTVKTYCRLAAKATVLHVDQYNAIRLAQGYHHNEGRNIDRSRTVNRVGAKKAEPTKINAGHAAKLKAQPDTRQGRRDALLMCLLLDLGMRCSEIAGLRVSNIDLVDSAITFYREKVDLLQVHELRGAALDAAMAHLPDIPDQEYLFPGYAGKPITTRAINDRVRTLGRVLPREYRIENLSPHDCRHYWATLAMRSGTDVASLQQAGGWSSPAMPLRYANWSHKVKRV